MEGTEVHCKIYADGTVLWKVVEKVTTDKFEEVRKYEDDLFDNKNYCAIESNEVTNDGEYNKAFWHIWPATIDGDMTKINDAIVNDNIDRIKRYQRPIQPIHNSK